MVTNDLKKGVRIRLRIGWYATIADNKKGDIRLCDVEGIHRELGSVYSHDILEALMNGKWIAVEHTPKQLKLQQTVKAMGF